MIIAKVKASGLNCRNQLIESLIAVAMIVLTRKKAFAYKNNCANVFKCFIMSNQKPKD